ncbi:hypothetical protein BDV41DRAFT_147400 [Aspergillus transmontanensis]|uniref:Uncharacterized protein n=1 Tax=Aspergillus transmontanensis TaxID=1034304 RepID=A0A5N6W7C1_9EURO|nr:hypothetical protein BDV41DRAFT_147400 [Aspergillus transmontanensis]
MTIITFSYYYWYHFPPFPAFGSSESSPTPSNCYCQYIVVSLLPQLPVKNPRATDQYMYIYYGT